ncbi:MAG TPA: hypothetical protein VLZ10_08850 [Thermodesulfobacteriota bacterium]|nr:hypothetical protein [Thermodesulfobacteriota bacterium]
MKRWIAFFAGLLLFGCASSKDMRILSRDLDILQSRIITVQKENNLTKREVNDMRAKNQDLRTDFALQLDNLESEIRTISTNIEEYKEFLSRNPEEIYQFKEEMKGRLKLEERRGTQEKGFTEIEDRLKALGGKIDRQIIRVNSWSNQ